MEHYKLLSKLPKVDVILQHQKITDLCSRYPRTVVLEVVRGYIDFLRAQILKGEIDSQYDFDNVIEGIIVQVEKNDVNNFKRAVNATGVVIHTNLGRSPLPKQAVDAIVETSMGYSTLEIDVDTGLRGSRYSHIEKLLCKLTGAEAAMAVNNNAAAVLLCLGALADNREVIVSRGQLVEIGGSFRIPEVMEQSGAKLVEVGATNKTHLRDYESAINENTALLLKVHTSNYRICGFTAEVGLEELKGLGDKYDIPVMEDIGSGVFVDLSKYGLSYEPTVKESIKAGMDIVTFSGDKLLGGPQAGMIVGKKKYIDMIKKHPLTRAVRIDKLSLAALEATLKLYLDEQSALQNIPTLNMLTCENQQLKQRAENLYNTINKDLYKEASLIIEEDYSTVGGGSMPLEQIPTWVLSIQPRSISLDQLEQSLRMNEVPIFTRISRNRLIIDLRTLKEEEFNIISRALEKILVQEVVQ